MLNDWSYAENLKRFSNVIKAPSGAFFVAAIRALFVIMLSLASQIAPGTEMVYLFAMTDTGAAIVYIGAVNISIPKEIVVNDSTLNFSAPGACSSCKVVSSLDSNVTMSGSEETPVEIDTGDNCNTISGSNGVALSMSDLTITNLKGVITINEPVQINIESSNVNT